MNFKVATVNYSVKNTNSGGVLTVDNNQAGYLSKVNVFDAAETEVGFADKFPYPLLL